jgi:hypothetical protein
MANNSEFESGKPIFLFTIPSLHAIIGKTWETKDCHKCEGGWMKRLFLIGLAIILGAGLVFLTGCEDEEETTGPTQKATGELDDPVYMFVSEIAGNPNIEIDLNLVEISFGLLTDHFGTPKAGKISAGPEPGTIQEWVYIAHDSSDFWHIFECTVSVTYDDGREFLFGGVDSIRAGYNSTFTWDYNPATTTSLNIRAHLNYDVVADVDTGKYVYHAALDLTWPNQTDFECSGSVTLCGYMYYSGDSCRVDMCFWETITDVYMDATAQAYAGCPISGQQSFDFALDKDCQGTSHIDSLNFKGDWAMSFIYADSSMTITHENATTRWTRIEDCR